MEYIEIIVLINLLIHIALVIICNYIFKLRPSYYMIMVSCIIDIIYVTLYLLIPYKLEEYKYIVIIAIAITPFVTKGLSKALLLALVYLMLNFTLGGISEQIYQIYNNFLVVIISLIIMILIFIAVIIYKRIHFKHNNLMYPIIILSDNKTYNLEGYCDTGNFLMANDNIPVVFINKKHKLGKYKKNIEVKTVSTTKKIRLYEVESFKIKINGKYVEKDVYLAYGDIAFSIMFGLNILGG